MTWLYNFSFSWACGSLSRIISVEIFDTRTRAKGVSIATMTSVAFNTMIGQNHLCRYVHNQVTLVHPFLRELSVFSSTCRSVTDK